MRPHAAPMTETTKPHAVVTWAGDGQPIMLTLYGLDGEVSAPLSPLRALELAKELMEPAVMAIKVNQWGPGWPG